MAKRVLLLTVLSMLLVIIVFFPVQAQRLGDRVFPFNPLLVSKGEIEETLWLGDFSAIASFERYISGGGEQTWRHFAFAGIDIVRFGDKAAVSLTSTIEFVANDTSDISFNPRAIWWEEGLVFTQRAGEDTYWQAGYVHRCKHDVDSYDVGSQRVLIFSGFQGKFFFPIATGLHGIVGANIFLIGRDYRSPLQTERALPDVDQLSASMSFTLAGSHYFSPKVGMYYGGFYNMHSYGIETRFGGRQRLLSEGAVHCGLVFVGRAAMRLGLSYEYLSDTHISVAALPHTGLRLGFTIGTAALLK